MGVYQVGYLEQHVVGHGTEYQFKTVEEYSKLGKARRAVNFLNGGSAWFWWW